MWTIQSFVQGEPESEAGAEEGAWEQHAGMAPSTSESLVDGTQMGSLRNFRVSWKAIELLLITTLLGLEAIPLGTMFSKHLYCWWMWEGERQKNVKDLAGLVRSCSNEWETRNSWK